MTETSNDHKSEISHQEYAKRIDEALGALSAEDKMLIDGVRFKILKDVDERIDISKRLHVMDMAILDVSNRCNQIYREQRFPSLYFRHRSERMFLMGVVIGLTILLSITTSYILLEARGRDSHTGITRGVLVAKSATAEADQLWCRYDLSRALDGQGKATGNEDAPDVIRPDEARLGTQPSDP